jgi:hypothetical protein
MTKALCELCGEPMPEGEEMFQFHGYSGNCPKPPLSEKSVQISDYERGQRDMLNAILALNPKAAQRRKKPSTTTRADCHSILSFG